MPAAPSASPRTSPPLAFIPTCAPGRLLAPHPHVPVLLAGRTQAGPTQSAFLRAFSAKGITHSRPQVSWALGSRLSSLHALKGIRVPPSCECLSDGIHRTRCFQCIQRTRCFQCDSDACGISVTRCHSKHSILSMSRYRFTAMSFHRRCPFSPFEPYEHH